MSDEPTSLHTKKNLGGRPPERGESKRSPISMRTTPTIRAALEEAAERGGRSLAQEIEQRLERSIEEESRQGGPATNALFANILALMSEIEAVTGKPWHQDLVTYGAVRAAIEDEVANWMPIPESRRTEWRAAEEAHMVSKALARVARGPVTIGKPELAIEFKTAALKEAESAMATVNQISAELSKEAEAGRELFRQIAEDHNLARRYGGTRHGA